MSEYQPRGFPDHSWIKLYVNIKVDWSGEPLNTLQCVKHKGAISVFPLIQVFKFKYLSLFTRCSSYVLSNTQEHQIGKKEQNTTRGFAGVPRWASGRMV